MSEPLNDVAEPISGNPIGASGMPVGTEKIEPTPESKEPEAGEEEKYDDVDFEDLKTVPKQFHKIAKSMQASFTKKMQVASRIAKDQESTTPTEAPKTANPEMEDAKSKVVQYMASPEGAALKEVFEGLVSEKLGTLPEEVMKQRVDREVSQVISKYGKEQIDDNYDAIAEASKNNPGVPLDYIVSNVLYEKAKEIGANEYKAKIVRKNDFSSSPTGSTSNVVTRKTANSWEEAVENAEAMTGV